MKVALTSVFVHDPLAAFKFYTEVLGFTERMYMPEYFLAIVAAPEDPDGVGLLLEPNNNPIASTYQQALYAADLPVITFGAADIHAEYERLQSLGVTFRKPPEKTDWGIETVFEDTCGNLIQLIQT
jgi:predicted enzyme related to lactoylglutathione lyase